MMGQKKVEIFSRKFRKSLTKQFLEVAINNLAFADAVQLTFHETRVLIAPCYTKKEFIPGCGGMWR